MSEVFPRAQAVVDDSVEPFIDRGAAVCKTCPLLKLTLLARDQFPVAIELLKEQIEAWTQTLQESLELMAAADYVECPAYVCEVEVESLVPPVRVSEKQARDLAHLGVAVRLPQAKQGTKSPHTRLNWLLKCRECGITFLCNRIDTSFCGACADGLRQGQTKEKA